MGASLARRLISRLSWERREIVRLRNLPRGTPARTTLIEPFFETLDGASFFSQYDQIFRREAFLFDANTPAPRILDCGANVGVFTVFFKRQFPQSRIVAFEPDPRVFAVLKNNVERCCETGGVELINAAVLDSAADQVQFFADHCDAGRLNAALEGASRISVRSVRLRDYLEEPVDLLKLDIEGAEGTVLKDCSDALGSVSRIFVEYHSFPDAKQELASILSILGNAGFRVHIASGKTAPRPFVRVDEFLGMDMQLDIWGVRTT